LFNEGAFYRPIPAVYFAFLYSLFGQQAFFYHFLQVLLHVINAIMLYLVLNALFRIFDTNIKEKNEREWNNLSGSQKVKFMRKYGVGETASYAQKHRKTQVFSLFLSLVFLVHPINVESVSYIAATTSELYFLPGILSLWLARKKNVSGTRLLLISCLLFLSVLAKETGFLFILLLILYSYLFKQKRVKAFVLSGALITGVYICVRVLVIGATYHIPTLESPIASLSVLQRIINIPAILIYYLKNFVLPIQLVVMQDWVIKTGTFENFFFPLIICLALFSLLLSAAIYFYKHDRMQFKLYVFFAIWFLIGMGLIIQIVPLEYTVSDRWFYFPIVGLLGMLGVGAQTLVKNEKAKQTSVAICAIVLVLLWVRTVVRNANFYDDLTLLTHDARLRDNEAIENNLGQEFFNKKDYNEAIKHFQKSVALQPTVRNLINSGGVYELLNKKEAARESFFKLLDIDANAYTKDQYNYHLSYASSELLYYDNSVYARDFITKALQKVPDSWYLWGNLAISEYALNNQQNALTAAEKAKTLSSNPQTISLYTLIAQKKVLPASIIFQP
jgi:tetratricopeptide (TPR) repeat protein